MPTYAHLFTQTIDFDGLKGHLSALRTAGVPYSDAEVENAGADARADAAAIAADIASKDNAFPGLEDKKITALIAYMLRLGLADTPELGG